MSPEPSGGPPARERIHADEPRGHRGVVEGLWRAARADRLPHALLFQGPAGVGKFRAAGWFALGLFCAEGPPAAGGSPCGACGPCKRVLAGSHPDLMVVATEADEEHLKLARFVPREGGPRSVEEFLSLRAAEGGRRVVLVREMERTRDTQNAVQNALLKRLEEPGQDAIWVLETSRPESLLVTILSRCVPVRFDPLARGDARAVLADQGLAADAAERLAAWSRGSPGEALRLAGAGAPGIVELIAGVLGGAPPVLSARGLFELDGEFPGRTPRGKQRARARTALGLALDLVADLRRRAAGAAPGELAFGTSVEALERVPGGVGSAGEAALATALAALLEARRDIERNLDPQAVCELAFCALGDLAAAGADRAARGARAAGPARTAGPGAPR